MPVTSQSSQVSNAECSFCTITNTCETRGRKRGRDEEDVEPSVKKLEDNRDPSLKRINKKPRLVEGFGNKPDASCDNSRFVPQLEREAERLNGSPEPTNETENDVARIISVLLHTLKESNKQGEQQQKDTGSVEGTPPRPSPYRRLPTSPLSNSPDRARFVRKTVGGLRQGCVDPGLQKWVLTKNLVEDVQAFDPSFRSPEWIEALHEMGWEKYHPKYLVQCDDYIASDHDFDDWVEIDVGNPYNVQYTSSERRGGYWKSNAESSAQIFLH